MEMKADDLKYGGKRGKQLEDTDPYMFAFQRTCRVVINYLSIGQFLLQKLLVIDETGITII